MYDKDRAKIEDQGEYIMIRQAIRQDASRLAEILVFAKRTAYRSIFQNDEVFSNKIGLPKIDVSSVG